MTVQLTCWKCGTTSGMLLPLGRSDECPRCLAELRSCRQCEFYDAHAGRECLEPQAEPGSDKERANFCDWFRPRLQSETTANGTVASAGLNALFGGNATGAVAGGTEAAAREELERLFGTKPEK
jgi:hypothetical protein